MFETKGKWGKLGARQQWLRPWPAESENLMGGFLRGGLVCRRANTPLKARCSPRFVQPSGKSRVHPVPKRHHPRTSRFESRAMIGAHKIRSRVLSMYLSRCHALSWIDEIVVWWGPSSPQREKSGKISREPNP